MKPTEVDSMNALRVQAENTARLYRLALELACKGDGDDMAFYVCQASAKMDAPEESERAPQINTEEDDLWAGDDLMGAGG